MNSAIGVINSIRDTRLERMAAASLREYVIRYINFFPRADCDRDIHFSGEITVDREKARCYTVCDGDYLPDRTVRSDVEDTTLPVSGCSLYMAELEGLGVHLHCNHAVNQILYFEGSDKLYEEFSRRVAVYRTKQGMGQGHAGAEGGRAREHAEGDHGGEAAPLPCQFFRHDMG